MGTEKGLFVDPDRGTPPHDSICLWFSRQENVRAFLNSVYGEDATDIAIDLDIDMRAQSGFLYGFADVVIHYRAAGRDHTMLIEVKTTLNDFTAALRQIRAYLPCLDNVTKKALVFHEDWTRRDNADDIRHYFSSQGVDFLHFWAFCRTDGASRTGTTVRPPHPTAAPEPKRSWGRQRAAVPDASQSFEYCDDARRKSSHRYADQCRWLKDDQNVIALIRIVFGVTAQQIRTSRRRKPIVVNGILLPPADVHAIFTEANGQQRSWAIFAMDSMEHYDEETSHVHLYAEAFSMQTDVCFLCADDLMDFEVSDNVALYFDTHSVYFAEFALLREQAKAMQNLDERGKPRVELQSDWFLAPPVGRQKASLVGVSIDQPRNIGQPELMVKWHEPLVGRDLDEFGMECNLTFDLPELWELLKLVDIPYDRACYSSIRPGEIDIPLEVEIEYLQSAKECYHRRIDIHRIYVGDHVLEVDPYCDTDYEHDTEKTFARTMAMDGQHPDREFICEWLSDADYARQFIRVAFNDVASELVVRRNVSITLPKELGTHTLDVLIEYIDHRSMNRRALIQTRAKASDLWWTAQVLRFAAEAEPSISHKAIIVAEDWRKRMHFGEVHRGIHLSSRQKAWLFQFDDLVRWIDRSSKAAEENNPKLDFLRPPAGIIDATMAAPIFEPDKDRVLFNFVCFWTDRVFCNRFRDILTVCTRFQGKRAWELVSVLGNPMKPDDWHNLEPNHRKPVTLELEYEPEHFQHTYAEPYRPWIKKVICDGISYELPITPWEEADPEEQGTGTGVS
jgi:hypothetical protein